VKAQPIFDEDGQVQLAVTIFSDITDVYEAERRKDEFIGIASHELKTPSQYGLSFVEERTSNHD
jgi:signal transduction histidine kinase